MKTSFYMTVGLPGCGKTSWLNRYFSPDGDSLTVFSSDELRKELFDSDDAQNNNGMLFEILMDRIISNLSSGKASVLDATNLSRKKRMSCLEKVRKTGARTVCLFFAVPFETCYFRNKNENREHVVPDDVMRKYYLTMTVPQYYEGWDEIQIIWGDTSGYNLDSVFSILDSLEQDNPNHTLTVGNHLRKAKALMEEKTESSSLQLAALLHDVGKKETKSFRNSKGEPTNIAHFYNHENVGAYKAMLIMKEDLDSAIVDKEKLHISGLILNHMRPNNIVSDKARDKLIGLVGKEMFSDLLLLNQCDKEAK